MLVLLSYPADSNGIIEYQNKRGKDIEVVKASASCPILCDI